MALLQMAAPSVERLAGRPAGIDQGKVAQPPLRLGVKTAAVPARIGRERLAQA